MQIPFWGKNDIWISQVMLLSLIDKKTVKMDAFIKRLEQLIWIKINLFSVKSEVIYLLEHLDLDRSKDLSMPEILNGSETFLASQMTYFGKIYGKAQVRESVFYIEDSDLAWEIFLHLDLMNWLLLCLVHLIFQVF